MARTIPAHRFADLIRASSSVFIEHGYRLTQMSHVAKRMGVGKGTLYTYVESKEALFALTFEHADRPGHDGFPVPTPVPTPEKGALRALFLRRLGEVAHFPALDTALEQAAAEDIGVEFAGMITELYDVLHRHRVGVKLVNRCSVEIPEIGTLWHNQGRGSHLALLERYITLRSEAGQLRPFPDTRIAARLLLETVVLWAVHLHWDPVPIPHDPALARETVLDVLQRGFVAG